MVGVSLLAGLSSWIHPGLSRKSESARRQPAIHPSGRSLLETMGVTSRVQTQGTPLPLDGFREATHGNFPQEEIYPQVPSVSGREVAGSW